MKHIKLYEDFFDDDNDDKDERDSFIGKNGEVIFFWEEEWEGMAGESMHVWKFRIDGTEKDVYYKDIKDLLKPEDQKEMERLLDQTADSNDQSAINFVR